MANLIKINKIILDNHSLTENFDRSVLENISWSYRSFWSHREIAATVILEGLKYELWNKEEYGKRRGRWRELQRKP